MPNVSVSIKEQNEHIIEPVSLQFLYTVLRQTGMYSLFRENINMVTPYSASSEINDPKNHNVNLKKNKIYCEIQPALNPKSAKWGNAKLSEIKGLGNFHHFERMKYPIFSDPDINSIAYEIVSPNTVKLSCKAIFKDKEEAYTFPSTLYSIYGNGIVIMENELAFNYRLPDLYTILLVNFYKRKTQREDSFVDYINNHTIKNLSVEVNKETQVYELVIDKNVSGCPFSVSIDSEIPVVEKKNDAARSFEVDFSIDFFIPRPTHLSFFYPVMICNNFLPEDLIFSDKTKLKYKKDRGIYSNRAINECILKEDLPPLPVTYPDFDDWEQPAFTSYTTSTEQVTFYQGLLQHDSEEGGDEEDSLIIDLEDMVLGMENGKPIVLTDEIKEYIKKHQMDCFKKDSDYAITFFASNMDVDMRNISFVGPLKIKIENYSKEYNYRIILSEKYKGEKNGTTVWPLRYIFAGFRTR